MSEVLDDVLVKAARRSLGAVPKFGSFEEVLEEIKPLLRPEDTKNLSLADALILSVSGLGWFELARTEKSDQGIIVLFADPMLTYPTPLVAGVVVHEARHVFQLSQPDAPSEIAPHQRAELEMDALDCENEFLSAIESARGTSFLTKRAIQYRKRSIDMMKKMYGEMGIMKCAFDTPDLLLKIRGPEKKE